MLYNFIPGQKTIYLLTIMLLALIDSACAEEDVIEKNRPILNHFTGGVRMVTRPVFTGQER